MAQTIGSVIIGVSADTQHLVKGFDRAEQKVNSTVNSMKKTMLSLAAAYASFQSINAFKGMIKDSIDAADSLGKLSEKLAISVEGLSKLQYAAGFADVSIGQLNAAMSAMIRRTGNFTKDGTGAAAKAMEELGISVETARREFTDTETTFKYLLNSLKNVEDGTLRTKLAQDLFSKSAADVVRLANMGTEALEAYGEQGKKVGAVISNEMAASAAILNDNISELTQRFTGLTNNLANDLIPVINSAITALMENTDGIKEATVFAAKIGATIATTMAIMKTASATMAAYTAVSVGLSGAMNMLNAKLILAAAAQGALNLAIKAAPFTIVATAVYALGSAFLSSAKDSDTLKKSLSSTGAELSKLTKNQLEYAKSLIEVELITQSLAMANAKAKAGNQGIFTSDIEHKSNLAKRDEEVAKFELMTKKLREIKQIQKDLSGESKKVEIVSNETGKNTSELKSLMGEISATLNPYAAKVEAINLKYDGMIEKLKKAGAGTAELLKLEEARNKEISDAKPKAVIKGLKDEAKELENIAKIKAEIAQIGMGDYEKSLIAIEEKVRQWTLAEVDANTVLEGRNKLLDELNTKTVLEETKDDLSYYERKAQFMQNEYDKNVELANIAYARTAIEIEASNKSIEQKEKLLAIETELYAESLKKIDLDNTLEFDFEIKADVSGFEGIAKAIVSVSDSFEELGKNQKAWDKYTKSLSAEDKKSKAYAKNKQKYTENEIEGYSNLAGAAAGMFEQNSKGYKALTALQIALQLAQHASALATTMNASASVASSAAVTAGKMTEASANAVASVTAAGSGDPYTAIPRVIAMIALMASAFTMFGGSGGGGGAAPTTSASFGIPTTEEMRENIELEYTPMTDRLDRQIKILEAIERNGSAAELEVEKSGLVFDKEYKMWVEDVIDKSYTSFVMAPSNFRQDIFDSFLGMSILDTTALRQGYKLFDVLLEYQKDGGYSGGLLAGDDVIGLGYGGAIKSINSMPAKIANAINDVQNIVNDWAVGIIGSMNDLVDTGDELKNMFDDVTGTMFYETMKLEEAFAKVKELRGDNSFEEYIVENIENIEALKNTFTSDNIDLLLSNDAADFQAQVDLLKSLSDETGLTFENGARDALDYLESIELVSEAMTTSRENIRDWENSFKTSEDLASDLSKSLGYELVGSMEELNSIFLQLADSTLGITDASLEMLEAQKQIIQTSDANKKSFVDSFKTSEELLNEQALSLGVVLATTNEELVSLFSNLSGGIGGLTDSELELLQANKSLVNSGLDDYIKGIATDISSLESVLSSLGGIIDKLKGGVLGTSYSMDKYYNSMKETLSLSGKDDIKAFQESLNQTIGASSVLFDTNNFSSAMDMQFAQAVALNQFDGMEVKALEQIDYLRMIEVNTREQITAILSLLAAMGSKLDAAMISNSTPAYGSLESWNKVGNSSVSTWTSTGGAIGTNNASTGLTSIATVSGQTISGKDVTDFVNYAIADGDAMAVYNKAIKTGISANSLDAIMGWKAGSSDRWAASQNLPKFYSGGYTGDGGKYDVAGYVHAGEYVINKETTTDLGLNNNNGGVFQEMLTEIKTLNSKVDKLEQANQAMAYYAQEQSEIAVRAAQKERMAV